MNDWIVIPNKADGSGVFAFREDQVITFHDQAPYKEDPDEKPRVRVYLANSTARTFSMSGREFAALLGIPTEAYESTAGAGAVTPGKLVVTGEVQTLTLAPMAQELVEGDLDYRDLDYGDLRLRLKGLAYLSVEGTGDVVAMVRKWVHSARVQGKAPTRQSLTPFVHSDWGAQGIASDILQVALDWYASQAPGVSGPVTPPQQLPDYLELTSRLLRLPFLEANPVARKIAGDIAFRWCTGQLSPSQPLARDLRSSLGRGLHLEDEQKERVFQVIWDWHAGV